MFHNFIVHLPSEGNARNYTIFMKIPIGIANSISANFEYDPLDTARFARNEGFELIQVYLSESLVKDAAWWGEFVQELGEAVNIIFHAHGDLNTAFFTSDYYQALKAFFSQGIQPHYILHFDETVQVDHLVALVEKQITNNEVLFLENYFLSHGAEAAEKNLKKYMALFTLLVSGSNKLRPVLDIPRFFHANLQWDDQVALNWLFQLMNFFSLRRIPMLLHLVDYVDNQQQKHQLCPVGNGYIPYKEIFHFIQKTSPLISGIILEYEDKLNPLKSRHNILRMLA